MATNPVYLEIVDFFASETTPQGVAHSGDMTAEQESELEHFTELEHILRMAKARARQIIAAQQ